MATLTPITATDPRFQSQINTINQGVATYNAAHPAPTTPAAPPPPPVPGAPASTPTTPAPTAPTSDYYSRYTPQEQAAQNAISTYQPPQSEDQIYQQKLGQAQGQIGELNKYYDSLMAEQKTVNDGRDRGTNALSVLNGLAGSSEATQAATQTTQLNERDNAKIQAERGAKIGEILTGVRNSAATAAQQSRTDAQKSAEDVLANRKQRLTEANDAAVNLAKTGVTLDGLKQTDPTSYQHIIEQLGGEQQAKAIFTLNRPQETILDKKIENGKYIITYQNPLNGKVRLETLDLGLPPQYTKTVDAGDHLLAVPDGWNGDPSQLVTINKGLSASDKLDMQYKQAQIDKIHNDINNPDTSGKQDKLEQQFRGVLEKEFSSRSGSIGTQAQKVDQAIHLRTLLDQYKDSSGNYNVPPSQYAELAMGLAALVSGNNSLSDSRVAAIEQQSAKGNLGKLLTYVTGTPYNGSTQDIIKGLSDSIDRQGQTSEKLRNQYIKRLEGLAPTGLDAKRRDALLSEQFPSYSEASSGGGGGNVVTAPDGTQVEITD